MRKAVPACSVVIGLALLNMARAESAAKLTETLQSAHAHCKTAHVQRATDLPQAKQTYAHYLEFRGQAAELDPALDASKDPAVTRVFDYCETVGRDIARSEALPVIQQGIDACGKARESLQRGDVGSARKALARFDKHKEQAVALAPAVLDVYSVMAGVRRCERLATEIESAFQQQQKASRQAQKATSYLLQVLTSCEALESPVSDPDLATVTDPAARAVKLEGAISSLQERLTASQQALAEYPADQPGDSSVPTEASELRNSIDVCHSRVKSVITAAGTDLVKLKDEQQRRAAAEAEAAKQAAAIAARKAARLARENETPEEKRQRLERNAAYYTLVKRVPPQYPKKARGRSKTGYVLVEYKVDLDGAVIEPVVIESKPKKTFDNAALAAVKQWQYQPEFAADAQPEIALMRAHLSFVFQ